MDDIAKLKEPAQGGITVCARDAGCINYLEYQGL